MPRAMLPSTRRILVWDMTNGEESEVDLLWEAINNSIQRGVATFAQRLQ